MEQKLGTEFSEKTLNIHNFYLLVKWLLSVALVSKSSREKRKCLGMIITKIIESTVE